MNKIVFIVFFSVLYFVTAFPVHAADLPRILIVGEDVSSETLPRGSRPFKQVLGEISNSLLADGFDVKDEVALSAASHKQGKVRRSEAELIKIAQDLAIDIVVIFSIYPNKKEVNDVVRISPYVEGRLVSVYDGSRLGNFDLKSQISVPVDKPYSRNDVLEALREVSGTLGKEVGDVLTQRIAGYVDSEGGRLQEWVLVLDGFNNYEIMDLEDVFRTFPGYDSHRVKSNAKNTERHNEFFYRSSADSAVLRRNLVRMFKDLNLESTISISGLKIEAARNRGKKMRRLQQQNNW